MKLPEYNDHRANEPLYHDASESSEWEGIKFTVTGFGLPLALIACVAVVAYDLFGTIKNLFH